MPQGREPMGAVERLMYRFPHPNEFYSTRSEISPKSTIGVLSGFSFFVYALYSMAFAYLFYGQMNTYVKETEISSSILGGDYECAMLSEITQETKLEGSSSYLLNDYWDGEYNYSSIVFGNALSDSETCLNLLTELDPCGSAYEKISSYPSDLPATAIVIDSSDNVYILQSGELATVMTDGISVTRVMDSVGGLSYPTKMTIDANDNVYVLDEMSSTLLFKYNDEDGTTSEITNAGYGPTGIMTDSNGIVYILEYNGPSVLKYDGSSVSTIISSSDGISSVSSLDIDSNDNLYVTDSSAVLVLKYDGSTVSTIMSSSDGLSSPSKLAIDSNDNIYVINYDYSGGNDKVFKYDGSSVTTIISTSDGLDYPRHIAIDSNDNVYVTDSDAILVFKYDGSTVSTIMSSSDGLSAAGYVDIDSNDNIYVTDWTGMEIFMYNGLDVSTVIDSSWGLSSPIGVSFDSSDNAYVGEQTTTYKYNPSTDIVSNLSFAQTDVLFSWYVCDGEIEDTQDFFSDCQEDDDDLDGCSANDFLVETATISSDCDSNGMFYTSYFDNLPLLSQSDVTTESQSICRNRYTDICNVFNSSPPYTCTRKVYTSFFAALSVAFANSSVFLGILVMFSGMIMEKFFGLSTKEKENLKEEVEDDYS